MKTLIAFYNSIHNPSKCIETHYTWLWTNVIKQKKSLTNKRDSFRIEGGRWVSNPRPTEPQSVALTNWATSTISVPSLETACKCNTLFDYYQIFARFRCKKDFYWFQIEVHHRLHTKQNISSYTCSFTKDRRNAEAPEHKRQSLKQNSNRTLSQDALLDCIAKICI